VRPDARDVPPPRPLSLSLSLSLSLARVPFVRRIKESERARILTRTNCPNYAHITTVCSAHAVGSTCSRRRVYVHAAWNTVSTENSAIGIARDGGAQRERERERETSVHKLICVCALKRGCGSHHRRVSLTSFVARNPLQRERGRERERDEFFEGGAEE
jgi:hypothetical protein